MDDMGTSRKERETTMILITVFFQMIAILIMIGAGYLAAKTGMMDTHTNDQMSNMIANIYNPMLVFANAANAVGSVPLHTMGIVAVIAITMFFIFIILGMVLAPFFEKDIQQKKIFQLMFVFSNLGFIGIPVVSSILGAQYVVYVTEFILIYNIILYTYGMTLINGEFSLHSLKAMINPGTAFSVAALLVIVFGIQLPEFLRTAVTYLGNVASPLALAAVGFSLAQADWRQVFLQPRLYIFAVVKLLVIPLLLLPLVKLAVDGALVSLCMVMFGMPVGNMPLILGMQKGMDGTTCSAAIILTTVLCVFTIPVLMAVL